MVSVRPEVERELDRLPGLDRRPSRHGDGRSYFVAEREIAHFHGEARLDVRLTKERIAEMRSERTLDARIRTRGPSAQWVALPLVSPKDVPLAIHLVEEAMRANA